MRHARHDFVFLGLSLSSSGLDSILPLGRAVIPVGDPADVVAILAAMADSRRQAIATAARSIVCKSLTGLARAAEFAEAFAALAASRRRTPSRADAA